MKLLYHPEARAEELEAAAWYRQDNLPPLVAFVLTYVHRALANPAQFPRTFIGVRRALATPFPYIVYFAELPDGIYILAVSHSSRHPDYWLDRLI